MNAHCVGSGHMYNDTVLLMIPASASQLVFVLLLLKCNDCVRAAAKLWEWAALVRLL